MRRDYLKGERQGTRIAQASLETIIIFGVSSIILLILLVASLQTQSSSSDALRLSQARTTINEITSTAEEVWSQGPGASARINIIIPTDINETNSGIINNRTINIQVYTKGGYTDISDVSNVNISGKLPLISGSYEITLTSRENDVLLTILKTLTLNLNAETYCESANIAYSITALDEQFKPRTTNVTIQLIDTNGVIRGEENKTTLDGLANGTFNVPSLSIYGYWTISVFDNETSNFKRALILNCNATGQALITIINCSANKTLLNNGEFSNLGCKVTGTNFIDEVIFNVAGINYSASSYANNWWNYSLICDKDSTREWIKVFANDITGYSTSINTAISITCVRKPVINNTKPSKPSVSVGETFCINTTVTDDNLNQVWVQLRNPLGIYYNLTLYDTGASCAGIENDSVYGANIIPSMEGNHTLIGGYANDLAGNFEADLVNTNITVKPLVLITSGNILIDFPDPVTRLATIENSFIVFNNNTVPVTLTLVTQTYDSPSAFAGGCTAISPIGSSVTCVCTSTSCTATWNGNYTISTNNFTVFSFSFTNNRRQNANDIYGYTRVEASNGDTAQRDIWIDASSNVPSANIYLSRNAINNWSQGINYVQAGNTSMIYVQLRELSGSTAITTPNVSLKLSKQWTNVTSAVATVTDKGTYWEINKTFTTITAGGNDSFNFTAKAPIDTLTSIVQGEIIATNINATNIHELGILVLETCTKHTDCLSTKFCNNKGFCEIKKDVGGNCSTGIVYNGLARNETCTSNWCRQDFIDDNNWYCVSNNISCTEAGTNRANLYKSCISTNTEIRCFNGEWINTTDCFGYEGCNTNSTKSIYCGWQAVGGACVSGNGCGAESTGDCNDCGYYYTLVSNTCTYTTGLSYCDKGCGATCDSIIDYYYNDPGDQCSYGCNDSCTYANVVTCADAGDLYGYTCYFGTDGCSDLGCSVETENCPDYCINDFDGGICDLLSRTDPSISDVCYYNRACLTSGCNLSSSSELRIDYCDYCSASGSVTGAYSPALNDTCTTNCPDLGTRYYDETISRSDDCLNGATQILTETYTMGYIYINQLAPGECNTAECTLDCNKTGTCINNTCLCASLISTTVFSEDFTPSPYYNYNWTRQGINWGTYSGKNCYGGTGDCAHTGGTLTESTDWINTTSNLLNLSDGFNNVYFQIYVRENANLDPGEYFRIWCYNSSNTWQKFYEYDMGNWLTTGQWDLIQTTLPSSCWISNAMIKITVMSNAANEDVYIDDITIIEDVLE